MSIQIQTGERLPQVDLAWMDAGHLRRRDVQDLFHDKRVILLGLPGAFTPVCTGTHLNRYIELAPSFHRSGFDLLACVTPENPWAVDAWSRVMDPQGRLQFYSDGNLDFGRATGLTTRLPELFLGTCLQRFVMIIRRGMIEQLNIERVATDVTCSAAEYLARQAGVVLPI